MSARYVLARPVVALAAATLLVASAVSSAQAMSTTVLPTVTSPIGTYGFTGHGYGHGRGMGQYGALGYALNYGWGYQDIVGHYYGGTALTSTAQNPLITVDLSRFDGRTTVVQGYGLSVNGVAVPADPSTGYAYLQVSFDSSGNYTAASASSCSPASWTPFASGSGGSAVISTPDQTSPHLVRTCESGVSYGYRGVLVAAGGAGGPRTYNVLGVEDYVRGVVPRESPASWGDLGGGKGMQALMAQAVAARSYALAGTTPGSAPGVICDTTSCQVFMGTTRASVDGPSSVVAGNLTIIEDPRSEVAVANTSGQVMMAGGRIARTEFSSSTGGWTVPGTFPAVEDLGDAVSSNPYHNWSTSISATDIAARLGISGVSAINVTQRNGLGDLGGRVLQVQVVDGSGASHTYSGTGFRNAMGTTTFRSDWFAVTGVTPGQAQAVVQALYQDVLGRAPDPTGLAGWTATVQSTGNGQVVANGIVYSKERLVTLVSAQYRAALGREPETDGLNNWVGYLERGAGVSDLQIGIYASQESLNVLGGGDTATWVGAMYASILGRPAAPSEAAQWTQVALTQGRVRTVTGIAKSSEAGLHRLDAYYVQYLGRHLDPTGAATWLPYMNGAGDFQVPGFIGGSIEYWNRAQQRYPS